MLKKAKTNIAAARPHVAVYRNPLINSGTLPYPNNSIIAKPQNKMLIARAIKF